VMIWRSKLELFGEDLQQESERLNGFHGKNWLNQKATVALGSETWVCLIKLTRKGSGG
jgi:hypothetical protein